MIKSAHQIWKEAKEQNLSDEEFKALLKKERVIIVPKITERRCVKCENLTSGENISYCDRCLLEDDYSNAP